MKIFDIDIIKYQDYRKYLNDVFNYIKSKNKNFTYGQWAKEIGLSSVSGLTMILKGQRHAGKTIQELIINYLEFDENEAIYFRSLIKLHKQANNDSKLVVYLMDNLKLEEKIEDSNRPIHFKWQMGLIREAIKWNDFRSDDAWIRKKCIFEIEPDEFSKVIKTMEEEEIILKTKTGYEVNKSYKTTALDTRYFQYLHKELLRLIDQSYDVEYEKRTLSYRMLVIKKKDIPRAKVRLQEILDEFQKEFDQSSCNSAESEIYLTALNFVPFTK